MHFTRNGRTNLNIGGNVRIRELTRAKRSQETGETATDNAKAKVDKAYATPLHRIGMTFNGDRIVRL